MSLHAPDSALDEGALADPIVVAGPIMTTRRKRRQKGNLDLWIPGVLLAIIVLSCFLLPIFGDIPSPTNGDLLDTLAPPFTHAHILGADKLGRDMFSRILYGGRVSFEVAVTTNVIGFVAGGFIGMIAGFKGGVLESIIMRLLDMLLAFPSLVLSIVVATYLGPSLRNVIFAISFFSIPAYARISRAVTLRLRENVYISAARLSGQKDITILLRHMVPNVVPQLMTYCLLHVGIVIVIEASLSYLGLGVPLPKPSWGNMISDGQILLQTHPSLVFIPGAFLFVTVMCVNLLGDALRSRSSSR
jgi:peptide/nickel transport system permease protein